MNKTETLILKSLRKAYQTFSNPKTNAKPICEQNPDVASEIIYNALVSDKPCMITRFGSTEMACLSNYIGVKQKNRQVIDYITGKIGPWWWELKIVNQMQQWSGFFPPTISAIEQFCKLMLVDIPKVDVLGSWLEEEQLFEQELDYAKKNKISVDGSILDTFPMDKST